MERYERIWVELLASGLRPCGLACRDVLRLEAGYPLYGQDMDEETTPFEARLEWAIKLEKQDFVGKQALARLRETKPKRLLVGLEMQEQAIPRNGYRVCGAEGEEIGRVTSGVYSYSLNKGIALAKINQEHAREGEELQVEIRGRARKAVVRLGPFVEHRMPR